MAPVQAARLGAFLVVAALAATAAVFGGDDRARRLAVDHLVEGDEEAPQVPHYAATSSSSIRLRAPVLTARRNSAPASPITAKPTATTANRGPRSQPRAFNVSTVPSSTNHPSARGIKTFQPRSINWSYRKRGNVARNHTNAKRKTSSLRKNQNVGRIQVRTHSGPPVQ